MHIHSINQKKSPLKISGKVAVAGVVRDSHGAVIFAIAQLSCYISDNFN